MSFGFGDVIGFFGDLSFDLRFFMFDLARRSFFWKFLMNSVEFLYVCTQHTVSCVVR